MLKKFSKAKAIYPSKYLNEMNISLVFTYQGNFSNDAVLKITGNSAFRIFDNGDLIGYGPVRAAHGYYRIDNYNFKKGAHNVIIELSGYNCNSFYFLNTKPFLQAEFLVDGEVVAYTGKDFKCYLNEDRIQKITRFSYQRTFAESYIIENDFLEKYSGSAEILKELECEEQEDKKYLSRNIDYCNFNSLHFNEVESGEFYLDDNAKIYEDRYMFLDYLKIFKKEDWAIDPNKVASQMIFKKTKNIEVLQGFCFKTYSLEVSKTGFISFDIDVLEDAELYFIFDEIDMKQKGDLIDITFYRNTTHNVVTYNLKKGTYKHITFEPYTIKYLRIAVIFGKIKVNSLDFILYENPNIDRIEFKSTDKKVEKVFNAAVSTFAQNAVDILTDCPSRERAGWLCDSYFTSKAEQMITGENKVEKNFLENYALAEQYPTLPKGMIPMCYPGEFPDGTFIPNWSLFYILELSDYLERTNDKELINISKEKVIGVLTYFEKFENELGLLENLENWVFVEWSKANDPEYICGVNFPSNMLYSKALLLAGKLFNEEKYLRKSENIVNQINKYSYNGKFYVDNMIRNGKNEFVLTNNITETCQYYAFYFDIASKHEKPELFNLLLNTFGPKRDEKIIYPEVAKSNVIVGDYFRLFILLKYNFIEKAAEETIDYFYEMADKTGTLWEHESTWASLNHGLTSVIINIILRIYFGIEKVDFTNGSIVFNDKFVKNIDCELKLSNGLKEINIKNSNGNIVTKKENF